MRTVVASLKGGSGKSTVTFNLGVWLTMAGRKVTALDLDPQCTLSDVAEVRGEEGYQPRFAVFDGMKNYRKRLEDTVDDTLVDVGTSDMPAMREAIGNADRIILPVQPSQADIWSAQRFLKLVRECCNGSSPEVLAFINRADTHRAVRETDEAAAALIALQGEGIRFLRNRLSQRTAFRRSFSEGLAVFEMEPRSKAARELTALAAAVFPEVLRPSA